MLHGAYDGAHPLLGPVPARGFSKDHRPDLKQLVFGLSLHGAAGIPLTCATFAGNTSDHVANRIHLDQLADLLPEEDEITIVADCKLVDPQTLWQLLRHKFHFVSLLPDSYSLRYELVEKFREKGEVLPELERRPGRTKSEAPRVWRGSSVDELFSVGLDQNGTRREQMMRFLVVESTMLDEAEGPGLERKVDHERAALEKAFRKAAKTKFACRPDAEVAMAELSKKARFVTVEASVVSEMVPIKRPKAGRPRKEEVAPQVEVFRIVLDRLVPNEEVHDAERFHGRHFVLVTSHMDRETWPDARVLAEYRHQQMVEGHTGFRWLKGMAEVAPVFLHTPSRIAALGLVFVLALMVRNYLQFTLRRRLVEEKQTVPDRLGKPTQSPTTETAMIPFEAAQSVRIVAEGRPAVRIVIGLTPAARTVLQVLGVDETLFTKPRVRSPRKSEVAVPGVSGM
jgi:transposase